MPQKRSNQLDNCVRIEGGCTWESYCGGIVANVEYLNVGKSMWEQTNALSGAKSM